MLTIRVPRLEGPISIIFYALREMSIRQRRSCKSPCVVADRREKGQAKAPNAHLSFPLDPSFGPKSPAFASGRRRASARRQARGSILGRSETCPTSFAVRRVRATTGQFENLSGIGRKRLSYLFSLQFVAFLHPSGQVENTTGIGGGGLRGGRDRSSRGESFPVPGPGKLNRSRGCSARSFPANLFCPP